MDTVPTPEHTENHSLADSITETFDADAYFTRLTQSSPPITFDRPGAIQYSVENYAAVDPTLVISALEKMHTDATRFQRGVAQSAELQTEFEASIERGRQLLGKQVVARTVEVSKD